MDLDAIRKNYRLRFNQEDDGIALFDLVSAFLGAYFLEEKFNLSESLPVQYSEQKTVYYLLVLPVGVLAHYIFKVDSFLTRELQTPTINAYKVIFIIICLLILKSCLTK